MRHLTEWSLALSLLVYSVGWVTTVIGAALAVLWLADVLLTRWLRASDTFRLFIRFAWLDGMERAKLRRDMEEEEARRKIPYVPPVDDDEDDHGDP